MGTLDASARHAVLDQLMKRYEEFAEAEQLAANERKWQEATIAHGYCVILLRAIEAEDNDVPPKFVE